MHNSMNKFHIEEEKIHSKELGIFDLPPIPTPSFTTVSAVSGPSPPRNPLGQVRGRQASVSGWRKTVTKHACPLSLTTFLVPLLPSHLQENVNMCCREKMYLLIYVPGKFTYPVE